MYRNHNYDAYLFINGEQLDETSFRTWSETDAMQSTGGRVVTVEASAGDKIEVRMDGHYSYILYCAEYISKM